MNKSVRDVIFILELQKKKCIDIIQFHYKYKDKQHRWQKAKQVSSSNVTPQTCPALRLRLRHLPTAFFF